MRPGFLPESDQREQAARAKLRADAQAKRGHSVRPGLLPESDPREQAARAKLRADAQAKRQPVDPKGAKAVAPKRRW